MHSPRMNCSSYRASTRSQRALSGSRTFAHTIVRAATKPRPSVALHATMAATDATIETGYWGIRGLGAPIRMMLMYKSVPFRCELFDVVEKPEGGMDASAWFGKKPELKAKNPLINLPYLKDGDLLISQSNAVMSHLGRKYGLWGSNEAEASMCDQLLCEIMDLRNKMTNFCYSGPKSDEEIATAAKAVLDGIVNANFGALPKLDAVLAANAAGKDTFLVGAHATAPDFHLWELLDQYRLLAKVHKYEDPVASFKHLATFYTNFAALPENARYLASPLHTKLPVNNKSAVFGSAPGGGRWAPGTACDWHNLGGVY